MIYFKAYVYFMDLSWTLHEFDTRAECTRWVKHMDEKYGYIKNYEIKEVQDDRDDSE